MTADEDTADGRTGREGPAPTIPADAPPGDTYGREHAAKLLGVSPRRISQLADEGRFVIVQRKPLRLDAASVHAMRDERRGRGADIRATIPPADGSEVSAGILAEVRRIAELADAAARRAIESGDDSLADARAERDRLREERDRAAREVEQLRADLDEERARRIEAESRRRRLF